ERRGERLPMGPELDGGSPGSQRSAIPARLVADEAQASSRGENLVHSPPARPPRPREMERNLRERLVGELLSAAYYLRQQEDYLPALQHYFLSLRQGRKIPQALLGVLKLFAHRIVTSVRGRRTAAA